MKQWKTWVGFVISAAAIWYAARGVDWPEVGRAMRNADPLLLAIVFVINPVINIVARAVRWKLLLRPSGKVPLAGCVSATAIGLMANNVLPARIGEFVRAYSLNRRERVPTGTAFGGLFLERMLDGFAILGILYGLTRVYPFPGWVSTTVEFGLYIFLVFLGFQMFMAYHPNGFIRFAKRMAGLLSAGRLEEAVERTMMTFADGFQILRRPGLVLIGLVLAVAQWSLIGTTYMLGLTAFDLGQVGWIGAQFATGVTALGVAVPSSPGFVGTYQALIVKSLEVFEIDRTGAFSFAVGFHAVTWASVTLTGLLFFFREGLSWREIEASEDKTGKELEAEFEAAVGEEEDL